LPKAATRDGIDYYHNESRPARTPVIVMRPYDFENSVGFWLAKAHHAYTHALQVALAPHGITFRQAQVIGWLAVEGPLSQRELADRMLIEPPNLVGVLDRMESAQLVERRVAATDARKKEVRLLPGAEAMWDRIVDCASAVREQAAAGLSPRDRERLKEMLALVRENLTATPAAV